MRGFITKGGIKTSEELTPLFDHVEQLYPLRKSRPQEWEDIHQQLVTIASRNEEIASDRNVVVQLLSYLSEFTDDIALDKLNRMSDKKIGLHHALWIGSAALLNERLKNYAQSLFWYEIGKENNAQPEVFLRNSFENFQNRVRPILSSKKSVYIGTCNGINYEFNGGLVCTDKDGTPVMPEIDLSPIIDLAAPRPSHSMATITNEADGLYEETEVHTIQDESPSRRMFSSPAQRNSKRESTEQIPLSPVSRARGPRPLDESQIEALQSPRSPGSRWRSPGDTFEPPQRRAVFKMQGEGGLLEDEAEELPLRSAMRKKSRFDNEEPPLRSAMKKDSRFGNEDEKKLKFVESNGEIESEEMPLRSAMKKKSRFDNDNDETLLKPIMKKKPMFDENVEEVPLKPIMKKKSRFDNDENEEEIPLKPIMKKKSRFDNENDNEMEEEVPLKQIMKKKSRFDIGNDNEEEIPLKPIIKKRTMFDENEEDIPLKPIMKKKSRFDNDNENEEEIPLKPIMKRNDNNINNEEEVPLKSAMKKKSMFDRETTNNDSTIELPKRAMIVGLNDDTDIPRRPKLDEQSISSNSNSNSNSNNTTNVSGFVLPKRNLARPIPQLPRPFPGDDENEEIVPKSIMKKPDSIFNNNNKEAHVSLQAAGGTRGGPKRQATPTTKLKSKSNSRPTEGETFRVGSRTFKVEKELGQNTILCVGEDDGLRYVSKSISDESALEDFSPPRPEVFALPIEISDGQMVTQFVSPYTLEAAVAEMHKKSRNDQALCLFLLLQLVRVVGALERCGASVDGGISVDSFVVRFSREELGAFDDGEVGPWGETGLAFVGCDRVRAGDGEGRERRDIARLFYWISQRTELGDTKAPPPPRAWNKELWSAFFESAFGGGDLSAFEEKLSAFLTGGSMSNSVKSAFARVISSLMDASG